jgi:hypothetical protein
VIQLLAQFSLVKRDSDAALSRELSGRRDLMVVPLLTQIRAARHDDNRFPLFEGCNNRSYPGMRHHDPRRCYAPAKFRWVKKTGSGDVFRAVNRWADLREDVGLGPQPSPVVHRADQSVERSLRANRDKHHSTEPV